MGDVRVDNFIEYNYTKQAIFYSFIKNDYVRLFIHTHLRLFVY